MERDVIIQLLATLCAGLFAGAAVYINLVEHPARMQCGTAVALAQWAPSYRRAAVMQASLAVLGTLTALVAWVGGAGSGWMVGALLLGSVVPVTLLVIKPTNKALLDPAAAENLDRAGELLARWNRLHAIRSLTSVLAFVIFVALSR